MRLRHYALLFVILLLTVPLSAQTLHNNPQKAAYGSYREWPWISSQGHAPQSASPTMTSHTHVDCVLPVEAEIGAVSFDAACEIILFMTDGYVPAQSPTHSPNDANGVTPLFPMHLSPYWAYFEADTSQAWKDKWFQNPNVVKWIPATTDHMPLVGDPMGVVAITGTLHFQGTLAPLLHGWYPIALDASTVFTNGDSQRTRLMWPFYMTTDLSLPEQLPGDGIGTIQYESFVDWAGHLDPAGQGAWGSTIMRFDQHMPLFGPIGVDHVWTFSPEGYAYGNRFTDNRPLPQFTVWADPNLHHGDPGTLLFQQEGLDTGFSGACCPSAPPTYVPLPFNLPDGPHALMFRWQQETGAGLPGQFSPNESVSANFVIHLTVGPGGVDQIDGPGHPVSPPPPPPPQTCQDPSATNVGGPLPCVFPPPPVPTWHNVTPLFQRLDDSLRVCDPVDGKCAVLGMVTQP